MRVPRPRWSPQTDEQRQAVADVEQAVAEATEIKAKAQSMNSEADGIVRAAVAAARKVGVPITLLSEKTRQSRVTIHKHLPAETAE